MLASIICLVLVLYDDLAEARNSTSGNTALGPAGQPSGIRAIASPPSSLVASTIMGVLMKPGCTEWTECFCGQIQLAEVVARKCRACRMTC